MRKTPIAERFWAKVRKTDGCWGWAAYCDEWGYGRISSGRTMRHAHRVSWELHHGPIPDGLCVLHKCDNPPCTNPTHLFLGTVADNTADMFAKGRDGNRQKTCCPRGHPYDSGNTNINARGQRSCKTCTKERVMAWNRAHPRTAVPRSVLPAERVAELRARNRAWADRRRGGPPVHNEEKAHCKHGHPFDEENTYVAKDGSRHCRACGRIAANRRLDADREAIYARRAELRRQSA